jgi:very-short-patch-repair endonuclease
VDLTAPFRGSRAIAAGALTRGQLRGPGFRRLFPDVYVHAEVEVDLAVRSRAAYLLVEGRGVLGGYSAAELLGASCGPADAPAEVVLPGGRGRPRPGLRVHQGALAPDEVTVVDGVRLTTPVRTAYDLARRGPLVEAVVAVDTLSHRHRFDPARVLAPARQWLGARGSGRLPEVVRLANRLAESPMESRIRLAIVLGGLPCPVVQHPVGAYRLDLAYPGVRLGIEYDGAEHRTQERSLRDLDRQAWLTAAGWRIRRFRDRDVLSRPWRVLAGVREELVLIGRRRDLTLDALELG